ncbi:MAG TPA: alcohol dehydrogenase catalytic domain-containing protein [Kofleriaceae bacterium]|jgi:threonine dehydrogenase-like Zn-dependent dehydrogenase|nr:alcohol dehydrogenase catalytic domain-containing protein [Kofleriaceae bacterium]
MTDAYQRYRSPDAPIPTTTWAWNMYGAGLENIGRDGGPEPFAVPAPSPDQLLVRVDAVGMCFSDVKLIKQGSRHPKLYDRDLSREPTRLGHEVALTVMQVGAALDRRFQPGQRLALQPDIYQQGRSTAYGYTIPGGLTQYHLIGPEVLDAEGKSYVLPLPGDLGYAETALTEPWACVEAAYTQRRRLAPRPGGVMWIIGQPGDPTAYRCSLGLDAPATFVLSDVPAGLAAEVQAQARARGAAVIVRDGVAPAGYSELRAAHAPGGFDDVIVLGPRSAAAVGEAARRVARRGTFNLVGGAPLDGLVQVDVGRIHYDYIAYVGSPGPDAGASYGEARNRCELRAGGVALFVGAGGPMGQMHIQRALELDGGPGAVIASDTNATRLAAMAARLAPLARARGRQLIAVGPDEPLAQVIAEHTAGRGADDVIVSVPVAEVMAEAATYLAADGMLVLFAGVPNGTYAPLELSSVYLHGAQYTGTSGSAMADQAIVIDKALGGQLSPARSVGAVGGLDAAVEGMRAMMDGRFAGKILIFPQIRGLALTSVEDLAASDRELAARLGPDGAWTAAAEAYLVERYWTP